MYHREQEVILHKLPPMIIFKRKTLPKKKLGLKSSSRLTQRAGWIRRWMSGWEKFMSRNWMAFSTNLHSYWSATLCMPISPILSKTEVKQTNSGLAIIQGELTKELQPLDIGVNELFKVKLQAAWEHWMKNANSSRQGGNPRRVMPLSANGSWIPGLRYQSQVLSMLSWRL